MRLETTENAACKPSGATARERAALLFINRAKSVRLSHRPIFQRVMQALCASCCATQRNIDLRYNNLSRNAIEPAPPPPPLHSRGLWRSLRNTRSCPHTRPGNPPSLTTYFLFYFAADQTPFQPSPCSLPLPHHHLRTSQWLPPPTSFPTCPSPAPPPVA